MKTFLKIAGAILGLFIVIVIGLNIYFSDERLKNTVMPYVDDAVGRSVNVEKMSLTFFSTFPQPGVSIENMSIPGETESDTLLSLDELVVSVDVFSGTKTLFDDVLVVGFGGVTGSDEAATIQIEHDSEWLDIYRISDDGARESVDKAINTLTLDQLPNETESYHTVLISLPFRVKYL